MSRSSNTADTLFNPLHHEDQLNGNLTPALDGNDALVGTEDSDNLAGGRGADRLYGKAGDDRLYGGEGPDVLQGHEGDDGLTGDSGDDWLDGGPGNDHIVGGDGDDLLVGDAGNDKLYGNAGQDTLYGNADSDQLDGGPGCDVITGGTGHDTLTGGSGKDVFRWNARDYDGSDEVLDFNYCQDVLSLAGLVAENGVQEYALPRLALAPSDSSGTWLIILDSDQQQELHRIHLAQVNLLAGGQSDTQVLWQMLDQQVLQLV